MRVAQIIAGAPMGGAELFFERLTIALARAGEEVLPVIRRNAGRAERLRAAGLEPLQLHFGGVLDLSTRGRLNGALRQFRPRVAVAWMGRAAAFAPRGEWVLLGRLGGRYDLSRFRRCDHLVANTRGLVAWITGQGWPAERVHYLPNFAADVADLAPPRRHELGLPEEASLVLALGRLHRNKGFDTLVRAMVRIPEARLVIAGHGPERDLLAELIRVEGLESRVHLLGWRQDTASLLATADVVVCPSRTEPLGNVIIEAWAAGRAVVACAADGPQELITQGVDGLLVPIDDAGALARAIGAVLSDPPLAAALAAAGRARYQADFAEGPVLTRWRGFLSSVEKP